MHTWKSHLRSVLHRLVRTHGGAKLSDIEHLLAGVLDADGIDFRAPDGTLLPDQTTLAAALDLPCDVTIRLQLHNHAPRPAASGDAAPPQGEPAASRFREGAPVDQADISRDPRFERFIREFARLEKRHEFMWAGYIVRELLPRLGFNPEEAKLVLDCLRSEHYVNITKVHNPKNPDFPATGVKLNREHEVVRALLGAQGETHPHEIASGESL
ncbi:hypothetical protein RAS1_01870 [Phycisphaerae bacterium RAS1]|nr:hypothetical protein RAS1_01870 [Phycisphaerae bacterium RAS1]